MLSARNDALHFGGAERQQVLLARELHFRGYRVSFVTSDHGQPEGIQHDGITVHKACAENAGLPFLRFVHPTWTSLWAAMSRAKADVYYQRGADNETGQVALWCRCHGRRFIFATASDYDCHQGLLGLRTRRQRYLGRLGLRLAHAVVVQTASQQRMLKEEWGFAATVVRNCYPASLEEAVPTASSDPDGIARILWVGRISQSKRLEWLLDVAQACIEMAFDVVGATDCGSPLASQVIRRAADIANVRLHGCVPRARMPEFYRQATLLCCTSQSEGFPNTFLEAWSHGVPVVTTFDPDGVVCRHGLGRVANTVEGLAACLKELVASPEARRSASAAGLRYCVEQHSIKASVDQLEKVIKEVTG
jgi:glycosyltransferase involved in cell wall biosynthesis